jgi:hypothetical protein
MIHQFKTGPLMKKLQAQRFLTRIKGFLDQFFHAGAAESVPSMEAAKKYLKLTRLSYT